MMPSLQDRSPAAAPHDAGFLASLLASSGDCIKVLDLDGRLIFMSEGGKRAMAVDDYTSIHMCGWSGFWEDGAGGAGLAQAAVEAARRGQNGRFSGWAPTMAGEPRWWDVHVTPILDRHGKPERLLVISRDVTDQKKAALRQAALIELGDALRDLDRPADITMAAAAILGRALQAGRAAFAAIEPDGDLAIGRNWTGGLLGGVQGVVRRQDFGPAFDRLAQGEVLTAIYGAATPGLIAAVGAEEAATIRSLMAVPLRLGGRLCGALLVHDTVARDWTAAEIEFARGVADRCGASLGKADAEAHQRFLNAELSHRMKNILAMAQAIALQTMRVSTDIPTATEVLSGRLSALGKAHDILLDGGHSGGNVRSIVEGALRMHDDRRPDRFHVSGPHVPVGHRAGLPLALIVHELATNAAKYGALSSPDGAVQIEWRLREDGGAQALHLTWTEQGGPPVHPPARRGFGTRLIERGLSGQVGGVTALHYDPAGLVCTIKADLAGLQSQD